MQTLQRKGQGRHMRPPKEKPKRPPPPFKVTFKILYDVTLKVFDRKGGYEFLSYGTYTIKNNGQGWYEVTEGLPDNLCGRTLGAAIGSLWSQLQDDSIFKILKDEQ